MVRCALSVTGGGGVGFKTTPRESVTRCDGQCALRAKPMGNVSAREESQADRSAQQAWSQAKRAF